MKIPILPILKQFSGKWMRNLNYRVCDLYTWQTFFYLDVLRGARVGFTQGLAMLARDGGGASLPDPPENCLSMGNIGIFTL